MIDAHKNSMGDPIELLNWTWLRVIINQIPDQDWEKYLSEAVEVLSQ